MKKVLLVILILILGIAGFVWYKFSTNKGGGFEGDKAVQLKVKKHSAIFNASVDSMMADFFVMKDAFVNADTATIRTACAKMIARADSIPMDELKKDTSGVYITVFTFLTDVKSNATSLLAQTKLEEMKKDFKQVNEQLYSFLKSVNYEGKKLYWQNCPMAFGDDNGANWVSNSPEIINPYLGKNHPEYKATMLHCGEVVDSIHVQ